MLKKSFLRCVQFLYHYELIVAADTFTGKLPVNVYGARIKGFIHIKLSKNYSEVYLFSFFEHTIYTP